MGKQLRDIDIDDDSFKGIEAIIKSMTPEERANPALLSGNRRKRLAAGSGTDIQQVNKLVRQFEDMRKMMKMFTTGKAQRMMQNMPQMRR
jgi:signal recognition particle subunit SRP54